MLFPVIISFVTPSRSCRLQNPKPSVIMSAPVAVAPADHQVCEAKGLVCLWGEPPGFIWKLQERNRHRTSRW